MNVGCDITGWRLKSRAIRMELVKTIPKIVEQSSDDVLKRTVRNVEGSRYLPGTLPVRMVHHFLAKSIKRIRVSWRMMVVFADQRIAHYAGYVHDGTRNMLPRRYLGDVIKERRQALTNNMRYTFLKAIRKVGRA